MTTLHVFQLHGPEVIVQLVNAQAILPTHELAQALDVPFDCLEAIHTLPCRPIDFPEMSIPAIVQRTGDVPLRTTDRLILIDIIYQNHPTTNNEDVPSTVVRTVQRVGYHVIRQTSLFVAGVYHHCEFFQDLCQVSLDALIWNHADHRSRPVRHGSYVLIIIPPSETHNVDTRTAAQALQHDGETDAMMEFLTNSPLDEENLALFQARSSVIVPDAPSHQRFASAANLANIDDSPELPQFYVSERPKSRAGAVLQSKIDLNPCTAPHSKSNTSMQDVVTKIAAPPAIAADTHVAQDPKLAKVPIAPPKRRRKKSSTSDIKQSKITSFFGSSSTKQQPTEASPYADSAAPSPGPNVTMSREPHQLLTQLNVMLAL